jgi:hypothetical protein
MCGIFTRTGRSLHDHRRADFIGSLHDGRNLLQIIHVECRQAVAVFSSVVQ